MREFIKRISILMLICFSFFYTDKVINMINEKDPLMETIVSVKSSYDILPVNATLMGDYIIPGVKGREVDVSKSYDNMKISGIFREDALVYKELYPTNSVSNNKNKYIISGNTNKREVAIIYIFNNTYIDKIINNSDITIFINHNDLTIDNIKLLDNIEIYSYGNSGIYNDEILKSDSMLINRLSSNKSNYCLIKEKDDNVLDICSRNDMHVVFPNIIGGYYEIKSNLSNGSIILLDSLKDIYNITNYIESKGFDIVRLSKLLSE